MLDDVLFVDRASALHLSSVFLSDLKVLLSCDLHIKHVLALLLLFL